MKIYCDKCHKVISPEVDVKFDKLQVGHMVCPKCHKENKRYISETDLLLYLGVSELFYLFLSIITSFIFDKLRLSIASVIVLFAMFVVAWIVQKQIDRLIYEKAYFKEDIKNVERIEDKDAISRSLVWQSMLYLALAITYITSTEAKWFFLAVSIAAIALTFLKFYLSLKKERNS